MIAAGLWATQSVNRNSVDGLFYGNAPQLLIQIKATVAIALYSFGVSYVLLKFVDYIVGLPMSETARPSET
jgi:Amt family ammonium transporter